MAANLSFDHSADVSVSETMHRAVGGLLSAQDLAEGSDTVFLEKAVALTLKLLHAFKHSSEPCCLSSSYNYTMKQA